MSDIEIEKIQLSEETFNVLKENGIDYVSQILNLPFAKLSSFKNAEEKTIREIHKIQLSFKKGNLKDYLVSSNEPIGKIEIDTNIILEVFPESKTIKSYKIIFLNNNGVESDNHDFERGEFSTRTYNALNNANIKDIKSLCDLTTSDLKKIENLGNKSYFEILNYLKKHLRCIDLKSDECIDYADLISLLPDEYKDDLFRFNDISLESLVKNCFSSYWKKQKDINQVFTKDQTLEILFTKETEKWMSSFVSSTISSAGEITLDELKNKSPKVFVDNNILKISLKNLIINYKIEEKSSDEYRIKPITLGEWISNLPENDRNLLNIKLNGGTLQDCGDFLGITRERARQIIAKIFKKKPALKEDDYSYWYMNYYLPKDFFKEVFEENDRTYEYLKINYDKGEADYFSIMEDELVPEKIYKNIKKIKDRNCVLINNKLIPIDRMSIIKELANQYYREEDVSLEKFYLHYLMFLEDNNLSNNETLLFPNERSFETRVQCQNFILSKQWRRIRYYEIYDVDINAIVERIDLNKYTDVEISSKKILKENQDIFEEIGIRDEYELHNLLKKTINIWNADNKYNVSFARMPAIVFGNANIENQVLNLLNSSAPISSKDFWKLYEEEYGNSFASAMANHGKYIDKYLVDGEYRVDMPLLNDDEYKFMQSALTEDFYTIDEIKNIYVSNFDNLSNKINSMNLKGLGYKPYSGYVLKSCFSSVDAYFRNIILENTTFNIAKLWKEANTSKLASTAACNSFYSVLDDLKFNKKIFEFSDGQFIRADHFFAVAKWLSNESLDEFVSQAIAFSGEQPFFTIESLIKDGFYDRFELLGFGHYFSSALIKNSKKIKFMKLGGNIVFYNSKDIMFCTNFIAYILDSYKSIDINKFINLLNDYYSVILPKEKIIGSLRETNFYYSQTMNKIYHSREDFYNDLDV